MKKISVIVLVYNQESYIRKAIEGVFMQNFKGKIQLIISNDASSDRTDQVLKELIDQAPKNIDILYTVNPKNRGATLNMYNALNKVSGVYLALCEGDDYWTDSEKLKSQYDFMEKNPDYSLCFHSVTQVDECGNTIPDGQFSSIENRDYTAVEIFKNWQVHTTSVFMRSEVLKNEAVQQILKDPELLYFDTPLYMAASLNGKMRGSTANHSVYRRHKAGISFGVNLRRDLEHNRYDEVIGNLYGGKIKDISRWFIFKRSKENFIEAVKSGQIVLAIKYFIWIVRQYKKAGIYIITKIKNGK